MSAAGHERYDRLTARAAQVAAESGSVSSGPIRGISWDRIYPRCVWCDGEQYALGVLAYSRGETPCCAVLGCGRYVPEEYRLRDGSTS